MAKSFGQTAGGAQQNRVPRYELTMGLNKIRLFGEVRPRYQYWVENARKKNMPFECLAFDPETETFMNAERDYVQEVFPDQKCKWAYSMLCLDLDGSEPVVKSFDFRKKLFLAIQGLANDLGDPTSLEDGWDVVFEKVKTGPHAFNVEYRLKELQCHKGKRPVTDAERELIESAPTIDEVFPRETFEQQKTRLDKFLAATPDDDEDNKSSEPTGGLSPDIEKELASDLD